MARTHGSRCRSFRPQTNGSPSSPSGLWQRLDQDVRVRRGEPLKVALIPGQNQATTRFDRHSDDVGIGEMI